MRKNIRIFKEIERGYETGMSARQLSILYNISHYIILKFLKEKKIFRGKQFLKPEWWEKNYYIKYTPKQIAKKFNINIRKVVCRVYQLRKKGFKINFHPKKCMFCSKCKKEINPYTTRKRQLCHSCSAKFVFYKKRKGFIESENRRWTKKEFKFLKENYPEGDITRELAKKMNRTQSSIIHKITQLNLKKDKKVYLINLRKTGVLWTSENNPMNNPKIREKQSNTLKKLWKEHPERMSQFRRNKMTNIEKVMEKILKDLNINYVWNKYIKTINTWRFPDFRLKNQKIIIECDGEYWHSKQKEKDIKRQKELEQLGFRVIRFTDKEILKEPEKIKSYLNKQILKR